MRGLANFLGSGGVHPNPPTLKTRGISEFTFLFPLGTFHLKYK